MRYSLQVDLDERDGALLRVLALVERRGFTLREVATDAADASVALVVDGNFPVDVLVRQLQRLIDVRDARITTATREQND